MTRRFELQFDVAEIPLLAAAFGAADDPRVVAAGARARERGHYTRPEFLLVCRWKSPRSAPLVARNAAAAIRRATATALAAADDGERMAPLLGLEGVGVPTASVLLHFALPDGCPILDVRALESLGHRGRSTYPVSYWVAYAAACRALAAENGIDVRTLDRALWQWSASRAARSGGAA
jgi:hypothetical protein